MLNVIALKVFLFDSKSPEEPWGVGWCRKAADLTALTLNRYDGGFY